jgi:hypothetical protein
MCQPGRYPLGSSGREGPVRGRRPVLARFRPSRSSPAVLASYYRQPPTAITTEIVRGIDLVVTLGRVAKVDEVEGTRFEGQGHRRALPPRSRGHRRHAPVSGDIAAWSRCWLHSYAAPAGPTLASSWSGPPRTPWYSTWQIQTRAWPRRLARSGPFPVRWTPLASLAPRSFHLPSGFHEDAGRSGERSLLAEETAKTSPGPAAALRRGGWLTIAHAADSAHAAAGSGGTWSAHRSGPNTS